MHTGVQQAWAWLPMCLCKPRCHTRGLLPECVWGGKVCVCYVCPASWRYADINHLCVNWHEPCISAGRVGEQDLGPLSPPHQQQGPENSKTGMEKDKLRRPEMDSEVVKDASSGWRDRQK